MQCVRQHFSNNFLVTQKRNEYTIPYDGDEEKDKIWYNIKNVIYSLGNRPWNLETCWRLHFHYPENVYNYNQMFSIPRKSQDLYQKNKKQTSMRFQAIDVPQPQLLQTKVIPVHMVFGRRNKSSRGKLQFPHSSFFRRFLQITQRTPKFWALGSREKVGPKNGVFE